MAAFEETRLRTGKKEAIEAEAVGSGLTWKRLGRCAPSQVIETRPVDSLLQTHVDGRLGQSEAAEQLPTVSRSRSASGISRDIVRRRVNGGGVGSSSVVVRGGNEWHRVFEPDRSPARSATATA